VLIAVPPPGCAPSSQASRSSAAANVFGKAGSGVVGAVLSWLAAQMGVRLSPEFVALIAVVGFIGGVAFALIHQRYATILARQGPNARAAYNALRRSLTEGGLAARTYAGRLSIALDAVDRFFGDAGMADRTLYRRAFGLRTPAPLWTAPAFDRCLLLAWLYPVATILILWAVSGHVGPAENALGLLSGVPAWWRGAVLVCMPAMCVGAWQFQRHHIWRGMAGVLFIGGCMALLGISYSSDHDPARNQHYRGRRQHDWYPRIIRWCLCCDSRCRCVRCTRWDLRCVV
jgi:hypothetical protein